MASYNGAKFISSQISSILKQLGNDDELIISDDGSSDNTIEIINSFDDERIILLNHTRNDKIRKKTYTHYLVSSNFENALQFCTGDIIFLADQDDIWIENKISNMMPFFETYSLVMSDCSILDQESTREQNSFFNEKIILPRGLVKNIVKPIYHGCCLAFRREILNVALPFPEKMILHDSWIGILGENFGKVKFIDEKLVLYRRHFSNSSYATGKSKNSLFFQISYRARLFFQVVKRILSIKYNNI
jgi:glycosyltransferase involved in cell wall biosynthesis